jgi:hypothetical protein
MTEPKRFAVPLEQLDSVRVDDAQQVQEQAAAAPAGSGTGPSVHPYGDGMADADGD